MSTSPKSLTQLLGDPQEHILPRDDDRDLAFTGWRLSQQKDCRDYGSWSQCTEVSVYATQSKYEGQGIPFGHIVTQVRQWKEREKGTPSDEQNAVGVHDSASEAVAWLKKDNDGSLGSISKKAWVAACQACPPLNEEAVERVV